MKRFDIAIIGGGASGLACAITAKRTNHKASVAVIERLPKVGKKILATGNGRCNLSNSDLRADSYTGSCAELLKTAAGFSVVDFFESLGVVCDDDGYGRIYPRCRSAASVLDALRLECEKLGVTTICGFGVKDIDTKNGFVISSDTEKISARSVILAGGGKSQPALGSNGSLLDICRALGIRIRDPYPALVPLMTDPALVRPLKGQRTDANVGYYAYIPTAFRKKIVVCERGEVQFTDGLLSGICVFDLSHYYGFYKRDAELKLDLLPEMSPDEVMELLKSVRNIRSDATAEDFLSGVFTRPMGIYLLKRALGKLPQTTGDITDHDLGLIADTVKSLSFPVTGTAGFERSQVTGGGIEMYDPETFVKQVSPRYEILKYPGMYACGEILDIFGKCGGFNLDFAFSSGALAGKYAASDLYRRN